MDLRDYEITNTENVFTPSLLVYPVWMKLNIQTALHLVGNNILRPHVKTCKSSESIKLMLQAGISHFKCATIAEAELLALVFAPDVLLAYQPVAANIHRLKNLVEAYPDTQFSCLVDNLTSLKAIAEIFGNTELGVFVDLNIGMNRTGVLPENAAAIFQESLLYSNLMVKGVHAYDGHINDIDLTLRLQRANAAHQLACKVKAESESILGSSLQLVIGGTPTFPIHAQQENVQCSPGTFIFWDQGYSAFKDLPFTVAALLVTRVVSIINDELICLDLGHKAVAAENPLHQRLTFINKEGVELVSQSEEHLVVRVADSAKYRIGELWYAIPYHICPTVALYNELQVVENKQVTQEWVVCARNRKLVN